VLLRRIVRRATPLDSADWTHPLIEGADRMALDELPRLVVSDRVPMPVVCGIVRPVIVVPAAAHEWTDGRRRAVLCHEIAHLRRRDLVVNLLGRVACAFHWFNPLVWFAAWRLRIESERACDDMVLGVGTRPSEYADHLLQIVCVAARSRTPAVALPMAERRVFEGRMLAILERDAHRAPPSLRQGAAVALLALFVSLPLAAMGTARQVAPGTERDLAEESQLAPGTERDLAEESQLAPGSERDVAEQGQRKSQEQSQAQPQVQSQAQGLSERLNERINARANELGNGLGNQLANALAGRRDESAQSGDSVDPRVVAALVRVLEDSVASVREDAAYALGRLEARGGVAALGVRLRRDPVAGVRRMAAWALGQIESHEGTAALADALRGDASQEVRTMAIWALGTIEDPAAIPGLVAALGNADPETRGRAAWAIGSIEPDRAPQELIDALRDPVSEVRKRAAWALGQIEDDAAVPGLAALLRDRQTDAEARRAAVWALGAIESDASRQVLAELLGDPDPDVRARAARAIGGSSDPWPWPWPMPIIR
jgi:HEAT repeat protein